MRNAMCQEQRYECDCFRLMPDELIEYWPWLPERITACDTTGSN